MHTTCGVQRTSSMSEIVVASVQTNIKCTKSLHCQTESTSRKSVSTQYTKAICKENYLQKEFWDEKFQDSLYQFLSRTGQLRDFFNLTKGLVDNTVDANNMAWQAVLHLGRYAACSSTTGMRYDDEYVEFLALLNMLYGSSVLNILRGPAHFGTVISGECDKGQFNILTSKCNFPIPSHSVIHNRCEGYSKKIDLGIIQSSLEICENLSSTHGKQFNLSLDGMLIAQGSKGVNDRAVNLWGIEKPVSISKSQKHLELELKLAEELEIQIMTENIPSQRYKIKWLLFRLTKRLEQMRTRLTGEFLIKQCLEKMRERNLNHKDAFKQMLSLIFHNTTQIENCVSRTLASNMEICKLLADMRVSKCCIHNTKFIQLHKQLNYFVLLPSEYLSKQIDLKKPDNNIYCTQYSDLWWELRRTALLTGSMIMKALGFDTLKAEKQHVNVYVKKRPAPDFMDKVKKYIQFGKENEVHAISMLVGLILPALKTKCYSFYEVDPQFIQGQNRQNLIEVSADGIIECPLGPTCSNKRVPDQHKRIVVKAKCVYPSTDFPKFPSYSLPF